ncbi:hypothetical protein [Streptomyces sp. NPDC088183]|uniref:hypothetical protein n=1 Tax=Streptomyces sp. NPDC088183 TaxID=3160992 RepID=UPI00341ABB21
MCATPEDRLDSCAVCGRRLHDDPVLGELTASELAAAETALQAAEHAWDLRALTLAAPGPDDHPRLAAVIRGGPPQGDEAERSGTGLPGDLPARAGHGAPLDALRHGSAELSFVECAPDGLHLTRVTFTEAGIPVLRDTDSTPWRTVVPALDADATLRRFQLAGGNGTLPPVDRHAFDDAVRGWLAPGLPTAPESAAVLLRPAPGWELLRRAAAVVARDQAVRLELPTDGAASEGSGRLGEEPARRAAADRVRRLLRTLPLLADHTLLLARADRDTGAVRPHSHVLFPAGSRLAPGETATAEVTVYGGATGHTPLHLPVLAGIPAADGNGAPAVTVHRLKVGALEPARLTFVLRGPGEVDLVAPASERSPEQSFVDVPRLLSGLPRRMVRPPRLDLLFTVELSGADLAETEERLAFVRDVAALLARRDHAGTAVRVGAVGHYDHTDYESTWAKEGTLLRAPVLARPPAELPRALAGWAPALRRQDTVSSLEDALHAVASLSAGHSGTARACRVLLVVGRRPPAPSRQHGVVRACPRGTDWRAALARLRADGFRVRPVRIPRPDRRRPTRRADRPGATRPRPGGPSAPTGCSVRAPTRPRTRSGPSTRPGGTRGRNARSPSPPRSCDTTPPRGPSTRRAHGRSLRPEQERPDPERPEQA